MPSIMKTELSHERETNKPVRQVDSAEVRKVNFRYTLIWKEKRGHFKDIIIKKNELSGSLHVIILSLCIMYVP